jgi:Cof subfamily protein (haloacid dehalogenase superfamily)
MTDSFPLSQRARDLAAKVPEALVRRLHIAVDADRTLTRSDRTVSPATQAAIKAVYAAGGQMHLCTGRQYSVLIGSLIQFFPEQAVHVVSGGAGIITTKGELIWENTLPGSLVWQLIQQAQLNGCEFAFGIGATVYASEGLPARFKKSYGDSVQLGDMSQLATVLKTQRIQALFIGKLTQPMLDELKSHSAEINYKEMANYEGNIYVDVTAKGVHKAAGLTELAKIQAVPLAEIITVGDEANDLEMIKAGWGVAMGNAIPELKALAKLIIDHTDNDGLAQFVMALIERKQQLS